MKDVDLFDVPLWVLVAMWYLRRKRRVYAVRDEEQGIVQIAPSSFLVAYLDIVAYFQLVTWNNPSWIAQRVNAWAKQEEATVNAILKSHNLVGVYAVKSD